MNAILKAACVLLYLLALGELAGLFGSDQLARLPLVALVLLHVHAAELVFFFKHVRSYRGPLGISIALTLLFGLMHWKPLADAHAGAQADD